MLSVIHLVTLTINLTTIIDRESDASCNNVSMFDALRETIYAEVATLISQNEQSPHYLIELFRELQMLSTDYLRQRALYTIQDLVSRYFANDRQRVGVLATCDVSRTRA